jgi:hypothetical protein
MNGEPQNTRTIRWHRTRQGYEWQYWNVKVSRWSRYTRDSLSAEEARNRIAQWCYGCEPDNVTVQS